VSKLLTPEKRYFIEVHIANGESQRSIASKLNCHPSTVSRELKRNTVKGKYKASAAIDLTRTRRVHSRKAIKLDTAMKKLINEYLHLEYSPDQISGLLKSNGVSIISHERIYQYIWDDKKAGGNLYTYLRIKNRKTHKRGHQNDRRGIINDRKSIHERPDIVTDKLRYGDWEIDLVAGKARSGYLVTATERKSGLIEVGYTSTKDADEVAKEVVRMLSKHKCRCHTITSDNGKEFANHQFIASKLNVEYYFADPYASHQRGANENANGLLRQYFPKTEKITGDRYCQKKIKRATTRLNNRPRKRLGYKTPREVYYNL